MLRIKTLLCCAILIQSLTAQWLERKNGLPEDINVRGGSVIEPVDSLIAFVTVDDGKFYKTSDAGLNWYDITSPTYPSDLSVEDITAIGEDMIWICGYSDTTTTIYTSLDGGETWIEQYSSDEGGILFFIEMFSKDSGMAAGYAYTDVPAPMVQTNDGGENWMERNHEYLIGDYGLANGIDIIDMDVVYFQKKWSTLSKSLDEGTSWDSIFTPSTGEVVDFYNRQFGLLATGNGRIQASSDGGITWDVISELPYATSRCIEYLPGNPAKVWLSLEWKLFFSEDSGKSWTEYPFEGDFWSYDIEFVDEQHGWILAKDMVYYTNTGDRIVTGLTNGSTSQIDYRLSQNYPNPFNPTTQIRYSLPKNEYVKISIYNTLGQTIESLLSKNMPAGHHRVTFNAQNLSSGIYYYRIEAGEFKDIKKMIFIK